MAEDLLREITSALQKTLEAAIATDDMLVILCSQFASASPTDASEMRANLKKIRESDPFNKTASFVALSERLELALALDADYRYYSLTKLGSEAATVQELRAKLQLIQGGRTEKTDACDENAPKNL
jgi:hypothetical protein